MREPQYLALYVALVLIAVSCANPIGLTSQSHDPYEKNFWQYFITFIITHKHSHSHTPFVTGAMDSTNYTQTNERNKCRSYKHFSWPVNRTRELCVIVVRLLRQPVLFYTKWWSYLRYLYHKDRRGTTLVTLWYKLTSPECLQFYPQCELKFRFCL